MLVCVGTDETELTVLMIVEIGRCIHVHFILFPLLSYMFLNVYNQVFIKCNEW